MLVIKLCYRKNSLNEFKEKINSHLSSFRKNEIKTKRHNVKFRYLPNQNVSHNVKKNNENHFAIPLIRYVTHKVFHHISEKEACNN